VDLDKYEARSADKKQKDFDESGVDTEGASLVLEAQAAVTVQKEGGSAEDVDDEEEDDEGEVVGSSEGGGEDESGIG